MAVQTSANIRLQRGAPVTVGIVVACKGGVVVGADRKVTMYRGTRIKSLEDKVFSLSFRDGRGLLVCGSGGTDLTRRGIERIDPSDCDKDVDAHAYRDLVERRIVSLQHDLSDRGFNYDAVLLFGMVDVDGRPFIGHVTPSGLTETRNTGYYTTGVGAPYAELVLQDSYSDNISIEDAKLLVASLIEKIGRVDNDVEGMDVYWIVDQDKKAQNLTWWERMGVGRAPLSFNLKDELDELKQSVELFKSAWDKAAAELEEKEREEKERKESEKTVAAGNQKGVKKKRRKGS